MKRSFSNCSTVGKLMVLIGAFVIAPLAVVGTISQTVNVPIGHLDLVNLTIPLNCINTFPR